MLSEEMYYLIKQVPRDNNGIAYKDLKVHNEDSKYQLVSEAIYKDYDYLLKVSLGSSALDRSFYVLTEKGQAAIEAYEQEKRNQQIMKKSLVVSRTAMWAAIASAFVAACSLIKMFFLS